MRAMLAAIATLALAMTAQPAEAGWEGAEWGMTFEQTQAATPALRIVRSGLKLSGARKEGARKAEFLGVEVDASYFYADGGLAFVRLEAPFARCFALVEALDARYGAPTEVSDQVILRLVTWQDVASGNRMVLMYSTAKICDLRLSPLAADSLEGAARS